jgi:uncharacterized protein YkwD
MVASGLTATNTTSANAMPVQARVATTTTMSAPDLFERRVQVLVNRRRTAHGLPRLGFASCPDGSAERWARYLAARDAFYHQSMSSVLSRCNATYAGETLGRGSLTPRMLVRMWMQSPGHRAVLLSPKSRRFGVGATPYGNGGWVVAANFVRF